MESNLPKVCNLKKKKKESKLWSESLRNIWKAAYNSLIIR